MERRHQVLQVVDQVGRVERPHTPFRIKRLAGKVQTIPHSAFELSTGECFRQFRVKRHRELQVESAWHQHSQRFITELGAIDQGPLPRLAVPLDAFGTAVELEEAFAHAIKDALMVAVELLAKLVHGRAIESIAPD